MVVVFFKHTNKNVATGRQQLVKLVCRQILNRKTMVLYLFKCNLSCSVTLKVGNRTRSTHLDVELVKGHDGPKVEEGEIEVVLEQFQDAVVAVFPLAVLQGKAHAAHDGEPAAAVEQDPAQLKVPLHETCLHQAEDYEGDQSRRS